MVSNPVILSDLISCFRLEITINSIALRVKWKSLSTILFWWFSMFFLLNCLVVSLLIFFFDRGGGGGGGIVLL